MNYTTAIVMSTYNGEKYIVEQLDSIKNQTFQPDKVVISDDKSTDCTVAIIKEYIKKNNLLNWSIQVNEKNIGWKKNFFHLLEECDADLIFLSDQDDVWNIHKLEIMVPYFKNENISVLVSDYVNKKNNLIFQKRQEFKLKIEQLKFSEKYLYGIPYPGCSYCIRKSFFESIKKYYKDFLPHDAFIYRNALLLNKIYKINQNLIIHRLHGNNAGSSSSASRKNDIEYYKEVNKLLLCLFKDEKEIPKKYQDIILKSNNWLELRSKFFATKKITFYVKLLNYLSYYPHFKTYIRDFFIVYFE